MDGMKEFPDQYFNLAVVDPPYFSGPEKRGYYGRKEGDIGPRNEYQISPTWVSDTCVLWESKSSGSI